MISNVELSESEWDCGSDNYLKLHLNEEYIRMFMYRVIKLSPESDALEYIITKDNYKNFIDKDIYLRSPITCKSKNNMICHKCYGYLFKKHYSRMIGYIAAQSIGERAAQLTLRTKHTSGATNIQLPDWIDIENGLIKTKVPISIISNNDTNTIINSKTNEEVDLPYSSIEIICENYKEEITNDNDDDIDNVMNDEDEDMEFNIDNNGTVTYYISDIGEVAKISLLSHDVVASVIDFEKYLKKLPKFVTEDMTISDVLMQLINKLGITNIHSVHYELLLSMFARRKSNPKDLYRNYPEDGILWYKQNAVLDQMMVNSMIFERFHFKLPKLLISDPNTLNWKSSIFMLLTSFEFGSKFIHCDPEINKLFGSLEVHQ